MSRYEIKTIDHTFAYGFDQRGCGFFFQLLDVNGDAEIDVDSRFQGITGADVVGYLDEFGVHIPEIHRASLFMDMPF